MKKLKLSPGPKRVGYARVSTKEQNLSRQIRALKASRCDVILSDKASGKSLAGRPQLEDALGKIGPGDILVVAEWDRATRSMWDGLKIIQSVVESGATIEILDFPSLDLSTPEGRGFLAMFSAIAERERERILNRTNEGRRLAKERGVKMGAPHKLTDYQKKEILERLANGETMVSLGKSYDVSHSTISRLRSREKT